MSSLRRAKKIDVNQTDIVKDLRKMGYSVALDHDDVLVGAHGKTYWFEIKDPAKTLKKDGSFRAGALKDSQIKLQDEWRGHYSVVTTLEQILGEINPQTPSEAK